ncbi:MAG: hypothetical protein ABJA61_06785 [Caldimonas sp.]
MSFSRMPYSIAVLLLVAGCATAKFDAPAEQRKLLQRDAEWEQFAAAGTDVDKTVSYWSDDALIISQAGGIVESSNPTVSGVASSISGTTRRAPRLQRGRPPRG